MMFIERDDPPAPLSPSLPLPPPLTDDDPLKLKSEPLASDDRWVENIIDGLAGVLRDVKH